MKTRISPDEILNYISFGPFQVFALLVSSFTYLAYTCDMSIMVFIQESMLKEWNVTITQFAFLPAATCIPNIVGAFIFSTLSDQFGRLWPYTVCVAWVGMLSIASAFSNTFYLLIGLRCMTSIGIGGISAFLNPAIIEFLPVRNRGKVMVLNALIGTLGVCLSCGLAWWLIPTYPRYGWRYYIFASGVLMCLAAVFRIAFRFESPRFLIAKGRFEKAWRIFERMARINGKNLSEYAPLNTCVSQIAIFENGEEEKEKALFSQFLQIFHPRYLRTTIPLSVISVTEIAGYLTSQLFLPSFLSQVGSSTYFTIMVSTVSQLPGYALVSIIVEWPEIGRLNTLRLFSACCMILFTLLAFVQTEVSIPVLFVLIFFFAAPIFGLVQMYVSEFYPTSVRSVATAYFYTFQALTYLTGAMLASRAVARPEHWLFPTVFAGCFFIQLIMSLIMNYEPMGMKLHDTV